MSSAAEIVIAVVVSITAILVIGLFIWAAVKDGERFPDGWAYFSFGDGSRPAATAFPRTQCFDCHRQHAASDNVFVQFYPVLRDKPVD